MEYCFFVFLTFIIFIFIMSEKMRKERDSLGFVSVPAHRYWGAQTQRAINNFPIGDEDTARMPAEILRAFAVIKKAAALANKELGVLESQKASLIVQVCDELLSGNHHDHFPLRIWQSGSGTQTNMNFNEVIANRANYFSRDEIGGRGFVHPNDHVNQSQSSNDTFPSAMHIAAVHTMEAYCFPGLAHLLSQIKDKSTAFSHVVKTGRTHLMDATPVTMGQELSAYAWQLEHGLKQLKSVYPSLLALPLGGTAVGTGMNAPEGFDRLAVDKVAAITGHPFVVAENKFAGLAGHEALVSASGALKAIASSLMKLGNDVRLLASGPRCGINEYMIPANEPGSSMMPGKVNPTQAEALTMVCAQVIGNDTTISLGGMSGHLQLNVFKPMIIANFLQSARILGDAAKSFAQRCITGLQPNTYYIEKNLKNTLMLATSLANHLGYDNAAGIAKKAHKENITLKEAAIKSGMVTSDEYDEWIKPHKMV